MEKEAAVLPYTFRGFDGCAVFYHGQHHELAFTKQEDSTYTVTMSHALGTGTAKFDE